MKIGIVILSHKNADWISKQLMSFKQQQLNYEICIVENSEDNLETEKLQSIIKLYPELSITLIITANNGYFDGNITGVKKLAQDRQVTHTLIINPDVSCDNWEYLLTILKKYFENDSNCFIAGPKITIPGFKIVSSPIIPFLLWREIAYNLFFPFSNPILKKYHTKLSKQSGTVFAVEGSAFLIDNQKAIDTQAYFDDIFLYGEETVFGKIAQLNKWNIYFDNSVEVLHHHPPGKTSPIYDKYLPESYVKIAKKFHSNQFAIKLFEKSVKHRFRVRKLLTKLLRK